MSSTATCGNHSGPRRTPFRGKPKSVRLPSGISPSPRNPVRLRRNPQFGPEIMQRAVTQRFACHGVLSPNWDPSALVRDGPPRGHSLHRVRRRPDCLHHCWLPAVASPNYVRLRWMWAARSLAPRYGDKTKYPDSYNPSDATNHWHCKTSRCGLWPSGVVRSNASFRKVPHAESSTILEILALSTDDYNSADNFGCPKWFMLGQLSEKSSPPSAPKI
jgi:hypothetical protein